MSEYLDWTQLLGTAVVEQTDAVQASIQILRAGRHRPRHPGEQRGAEGRRDRWGGHDRAGEQGPDVRAAVRPRRIPGSADAGRSTFPRPTRRPAERRSWSTSSNRRRRPRRRRRQWHRLTRLHPPRRPKPCRRRNRRPKQLPHRLRRRRSPMPRQPRSPMPRRRRRSATARRRARSGRRAATFAGGAAVGGLLGYVWGDDDNDNDNDNDDGWDDVEDAIRDLDDDDWDDFVDRIDEDDFDQAVDRLNDRDWDEVRRAGRDVNISDSTIVVGNDLKRNQLDAKLKNKRDAKANLTGGQRTRVDMKDGVLKREGGTRVAAVDTRRPRQSRRSGLAGWRPPTPRASGARAGRPRPIGRRGTSSCPAQRVAMSALPPVVARRRCRTGRPGRAAAPDAPAAGGRAPARQPAAGGEPGRGIRHRPAARGAAGAASAARPARRRPVSSKPNDRQLPRSAQAAASGRRKRSRSGNARPLATAVATSRWATSRAARAPSGTHSGASRALARAEGAARAADGGTSHELQPEAQHGGSHRHDRVQVEVAACGRCAPRGGGRAGAGRAAKLRHARCRVGGAQRRAPGQGWRRPGEPTWARASRGPDRRRSRPGATVDGRAQRAGEPGRQARTQRRTGR